MAVFTVCLLTACNTNPADSNSVSTPHFEEPAPAPDITTDSLMTYLKKTPMNKGVEFEDGMKITIKDVTTSKVATYAYYTDYFTNYRQRTAEKGNTMIVSKVVLHNSTKTVHFPKYEIYRIDTVNHYVCLIDHMYYQFSRFDNHANQIGLYIDKKNHFDYVDDVKFTCFYGINKSLLENNIICLAINNLQYTADATYNTHTSIATYDYISYDDVHEEVERIGKQLRYDEFLNSVMLVKIFNLKKPPFAFALLHLRQG